MTQSMADMKEAIKIEPNFADAFFVRGLIFSDIGETERAIDEIEKALDLGLEREAGQYAESVLAELKMK